MITKIDWIKTKLKQNNFDKSIVYALYEDFREDTGSWSFSKNSYKRYVRKAFNSMEETIDQDLGQEEEFEDEFVKLSASKQRIMDSNNLLRKTNRETYRLYTALAEPYKQYVKALESIDLTNFKIQEHKSKEDGKCGILQLSDVHCNELIDAGDSFDNEYNFEILSKRLKKFVFEATKEFKANEVKDVYLFMTGDLLNSSRRLSEKVAMESALTSASLLLTYLLEQAIIELTKDFNVSVSFVVGNESRIGDDNMDSHNLIASTNYDFLVFHNLRLLFRNTPVEFITPANLIHNYVQLKNGFNAYLTHGHTLKGSVEKALPQILNKYAYKGIRIHGAFLGHFHHCHIGDIISQCGSMCGGNAYSSNDLHFMTRASQNIYIADKDSYKGIKIDLQNTTDYKGYDIIKELEQYSSSKSAYNNKVTIQNFV